MDAAPSVEKQSWHLGHLDALRGIAVLGVLIVHCAEHSPLPPAWAQLARNGQRGVQLFFLVSAFTLLLSSENRRRAEAHPARNFFIRRIFRLTPMYYGAIALTAWLLPWVLGGWQSVALGAFFAQGVTPYAIVHVAPGAWTLSDEAAFYLCLPLLALFIRSLKRAAIAFAILTPISTLLSFLLARQYPEHYEYFSFLWFPVELPVFLMGIVLYFFWKEWIKTGHLCSRDKTRLASLLFLAGFLVLLALNIPDTNRKLYLSSAGWALFVIAVLLHPWPLLVNRATIFLGKISFSVYLLHAFFLEPILRFTDGQRVLSAHPELKFFTRLLADLVLTSIAASVTWLYIEESGIRLGRRLIATLEHRSVRRQATSLPVPAAALLEETNSADAQF